MQIEFEHPVQCGFFVASNLTCLTLTIKKIVRNLEIGNGSNSDLRFKIINFFVKSQRAFIFYICLFSFSGDTIRIFRRSRSGRPTSAQSTEVLESQDDKLLRTEDLPAPDTIAGVKEANAK